MSLRKGAKTIVNQCMNIAQNESVLILNDSNDEEFLKALTQELEQAAGSHKYLRYQEPANHGEEPPEHIAEEMKKHDVVIAPTKKSLSHTKARVNACEYGVRVATLPGITKEIWNTSLQADYNKVKEISEKVYDILEDTEKVSINTPSGTDLTLKINIDFFHTDTGIIHEPGQFGNLPAGEADGGAIEANGTLVVDHFPFAPSGTKIEIKDNKAVSVEHPDQEESDLSEAFEKIEGSRVVAEFGFGTNPEATLIGNVLQDEKVLGTVHIAFGDNTSYIPKEDERHNPCEIHWDTICENPTVKFDEKTILDSGEPSFL